MSLIISGTPKSKYWEATLEDVLDVIAKLPEIAALIYRCSFADGKLVKDTSGKLDYSASFNRMLGYDSPAFDELMRLYLVIHTDHEGKSTRVFGIYSHLLSRSPPLLSLHTYPHLPSHLPPFLPPTPSFLKVAMPPLTLLTWWAPPSPIPTSPTLGKSFTNRLQHVHSSYTKNNHLSSRRTDTAQNTLTSLPSHLVPPTPSYLPSSVL